MILKCCNHSCCIKVKSCIVCYTVSSCISDLWITCASALIISNIYTLQVCSAENNFVVLMPHDKYLYIYYEINNDFYENSEMEMK